MYQFDNLLFKYDETIFQNVTLKINENKIGVIGENGIGKTTLLKLLDGELVPTKGNIYTGEYTYYVNFMLEKYCRFTLRDLLKICECMKSFDLTPIDKIIECLNVEKYIDTEIGKMSKGTAKKVSILLGFLTKNKILLIDEPFESLDEKTNKNLVNIFNLSRRPMVIVSHDISLLEQSVDAIYEIVDKNIKLRNMNEEI